MDNDKLTIKPEKNSKGRIMKKTVLTVIFSLVFAALSAANNYSSLVAEGDSFWTNRDNQSSLLKAIDYYEKALSQHPKDEILLARLVRAYYWKGMNMPDENKTERMAAFQVGMEYGKKLFEINPESVAGNFWYTSNMARYGADRGILKSLSYLSELKERVNFVLENDRQYFHGAAHRFFAKLTESVPGLLRKSLTGYSLTDAEALLKEALEIEKNFAMTHLFLGDIYMAMKKKDLAKKEYQSVLEISESSIPDCAAEIRRDKKAALVALKKHFDINE